MNKCQRCESDLDVKTGVLNPKTGEMQIYCLECALTVITEDRLQRQASRKKIEEN